MTIKHFLKSGMLLGGLFVMSLLSGQQIALNFSVNHNDLSARADSILVINASQGDTLILRYPDTSLVFGSPITSISDVDIIDNIELKQNYPNPFIAYTDFAINLSKPDQVTIKVHDITGKLIANYNELLASGGHSFRFHAGNSNLYILTVQTTRGVESMKMVQVGKSSNTNSEITYSGQTMYEPTKNSISDFKSADSDILFVPGDSLYYYAYITYGRQYKDTIADNPSESKRYTFETEWVFRNDPEFGFESIFSPFYFDGLYKRFYPLLTDLRSDELNSNSPWPVISELGNFTSINENGVYWAWREIYDGILRANEVLTYFPVIDMNADLRTRMMAEAKFLRGLYYMHLLDLFKEGPVYTELWQSKGEYAIAKASRSSIYDLIISDFSSALPSLPLKSEYAIADSIHITKGAAAGYLAKTYVLSEKWSLAKPLLEAIIAQNYGTYSLVYNYLDNCIESGERNEESLFELIFSRDLRGDEIFWFAGSGNDKNMSMTTARAQTYLPAPMGNGDVQVNNSLYLRFIQDSTKDGKVDPRCDATLATRDNFDSVYAGSTYSYSNIGLYRTDSASIRKWNNEGAAAENVDWESEINFRLLRYAEILLLYAETLNELDNTANAYTYLQQVRERVNLPELDAGMTQSQMRMAIANERSLEFAVEYKRYIDIRRWGWLSDTDRLEELKANDSEYENFVEGKEFYPIPTSALQENKNLQQDPGWVE